MTRSLNLLTLRSAMGHWRRRLSVMAFLLSILVVCPSCSMFIAESGKKVGLPETRDDAVEKWGDPIVTKLVKRGDPLIAELKKYYQRSQIESIYRYDVFLYRGKVQNRDLSGAAGMFDTITLGAGEILSLPSAVADAGISLIKKHYFFSGYNAKGKTVFFMELHRDGSKIVESGRLGKID